MVGEEGYEFLDWGQVGVVNLTYSCIFILIFGGSSPIKHLIILLLLLLKLLPQLLLHLLKLKNLPQLLFILSPQLPNLLLNLLNQ